MPLWEYKHISSGPHGFATPALLESHLNQLGKDEWEIIHYQTLPANPLAFYGIARRSTTREWTLEAAATAAAKAEADKLRAEFAAKFQAASAPAAPTDEKPALLATETAGTDDGLRRLRDTERDHDPEALAEESARDSWDDWDETAEALPTFFEAIKPHLRRNLRGPGQSVALDYLAKRWGQPEADLLGAVQECGFAVPEAEDSPAEYLEFEGDLYWLNRNGRGQLFLNTREKPRAVFRAVAAQKLDPADPAAVTLAGEAAAEQAAQARQAEERIARQAEQDARRAEAAARRQAAAAAAAAPAAGAAQSAPTTVHPNPAPPLPAGEELLALLRPLMRRNRRGPGWSGSITFLARALRRTDAEISAGLAAVGLTPPENADAKPLNVEIGEHVYWLNLDSRGGFGSMARNADPTPLRQPPPNPAEAASAAAPNAESGVAGASASSASDVVATATEVAPPPQGGATEKAAVGHSESANGSTASPLTAVRLLLKPNKRGSGVSGEVGYLARTLNQPEPDFLATLATAGVVRPTDPESKPDFVELDGEIYWLNQNPADGSLWLNAKASRRSAGRPPRRNRRSGLRAGAGFQSIGQRARLILAAPARQSNDSPRPRRSGSHPALAYLISLWSVWRLRCGLYFFFSIRSVTVFLFR